MEEEYEIKHTAFGDIKVRKSKPASHDDDEPITLDPCFTNQEPAAVEEEEEEHVMTPEEIEDNIRQAYEHYDAGDYAEAASLLEAIVFQECSDTPADVLSLLALMYWEGKPAEMADCRLAGTLLGLTNFYAYAASEYHRLHLHSNTASRLVSLSHYLMGFDPDHRYHHYTLF